MCIYRLFLAKIYFCSSMFVFSSGWNLQYFEAVTIVHPLAVSSLKIVEDSPAVIALVSDFVAVIALLVSDFVLL